MSNITYPPNNNPSYYNSLNSTSINFPNTEGFNNNNLNKTNTGSNMFPPNGYSSPSPFGNFRGMTTPQLNRFNNSGNRWNNLSTAFNQNTPLIHSNDFTNKKNMLHNNLHDNILHEEVIEYEINLDSKDRDINAFPDPFHYKVTFNPPSSRPDKDNVVFTGPPKPHISREFKNVKYIKLDKIILPQYFKTIIDGGPHIVDTGSNNMINERFILLSIKELNNSFTYGTNSSNEDNFASVYPDTFVGSKFYYGSSSSLHNGKMFKDSQLGNIKTLTIDFLDSHGNPIYVDGLDTSITDITDARHPLYPDFQTHITLKAYVVENEINIKTKYER